MEKERVLLKISGEALSGEGQTGYSIDRMRFIAEEIVSVENLHEIGLVIGGGNLIRGSRLRKDLGMNDSVVADYAGMMATVINAIIFQEVLEKQYGLATRVLSAIEVKSVAEPFIRRRAVNHLEKNRVVIFAAGTGNPDFSTDTAMVLRAYEIGAKLVLKGTKVDGIYDKDPKSYSDAQFIENLSYMEYLNRKLEIVDATAVTLASKHNLAIRVFDIFKRGNLRKVLAGEKIGSEIG